MDPTCFAMSTLRTPVWWGSSHEDVEFSAVAETLSPVDTASGMLVMVAGRLPLALALVPLILPVAIRASVETVSCPANRLIAQRHHSRHHSPSMLRKTFPGADDVKGVLMAEEPFGRNIRDRWVHS